MLDLAYIMPVWHHCSLSVRIIRSIVKLFFSMCSLSENIYYKQNLKLQTVPPQIC